MDKLYRAEECKNFYGINITSLEESGIGERFICGHNKCSDAVVCTCEIFVEFDTHFELKERNNNGANR